ncbi:MAG TPA: GNAT family N-acetyltransferase [Myxococcales bacterium]
MNVRPFALSDLEGAARFAQAARERDRFVEPFGERLSSLANGERARLSVWRVLDGDDGKVRGIAFAAARDSATLDVYAAVDPLLRRQGFGRALLGAALGLPVKLRARVAEEATAGRAFLSAVGFAHRTSQLSLQLARVTRSQRAVSSATVSGPPPPAIAVRPARREDEPALRRLSNEAWAGAPDVFAAQPEDEVFADDRTVWLAERGGHPVGYLAGRKLDRAIAIEELAVLPSARRLGVGSALVRQALDGRDGALLSVAEDNLAARALYERLGFTASLRRLVYEREPL